jgi:hypothetical protein
VLLHDPEHLLSQDANRYTLTVLLAAGKAV